MATPIDTVKAFLDKYGWKYDDLNQDTILSGFAGEKSRFTLFVKAAEDWLILSISPFVERPKPGCLENTLNYLAQLNFHATLVKFSVDEKGNIVLTVELPTNGLTFESFVASLEALCFYADDQHETVSSLATNPSAEPPTLSFS
jgi:hypothetical protein